MKKLFTSVVALFFFSLLQAQITQIASGLNTPQRLIVYNNYIYFTDTNSVQRFDANQNPATPEMVVDGLNSGAGMVQNGNDLYIADGGGGRIVKIDITASNPVLENVVTGLLSPYGLAISGNFLYFSEYSKNRIAKIDITISNPTPQTVVQGVTSPSGIDIKGDFLYFGETIPRRIRKIDITVSNPSPVTLVEFYVFPFGIKFRGDDLYIASRNGNKISTYNIITEVFSDIITGLNLPLDVAFKGNTLYFVSEGDSSIYKVEGILGVNEFNSDPAINLYPNPAQSFIKLNNVAEETSYTIYAMDGKRVAEGNYLPYNDISIKDLATGVYIFKTQDGRTMKFLKE
ncbi:MAG TPA: T9SS type A sorting domain-containing protein [Aequorivita sp.]|nr:T9SS type A sorting domain-containing protein [Aequorivita sp.]